ncbi:hypothetical protein V5P93_004542 [Actinokineospora auranticolor]|uniref:Uncharacterized protein n=1 Tax=Actinokineospora auranticolor TaxID=155976 RepID=A0A2S6GSX7_9PSEU|nr:hypothetical protein [Actinokineospora auranticolor]PPK68352.1 hypothetical protein CLV40_10575 [Actinokineospora auranticolor]
MGTARWVWLGVFTVLLALVWFDASKGELALTAGLAGVAAVGIVVAASDSAASATRDDLGARPRTGLVTALCFMTVTIVAAVVALGFLG